MSAPTIKWDPDFYTKKHNFVFQYGKDVITLLNPQANENILDIGCGTGQLTAEIAAACRNVVGIDNSATMIATAKNDYPTVEFICVGALDFCRPDTYDAVFSNAAMHWIHDQNALLKNVAASLKKGGRFVFEMGGYKNVHNIVLALNRHLTKLGLPNDYTNCFPKTGEQITRLENHGLTVREAYYFNRDTPLQGEFGIRNWIKMFRAHLLSNIPEIDLDNLFDRIETDVRDQNHKNGGWIADYKRLRVFAEKQ